MGGHTTLTCDEFLDLAAVVAVDAADPEDVRRVEDHAAGCPDCGAQLDELRAAAAGLAAFVPQVEPPPDLRERLLASVQREPRRLGVLQRMWPRALRLPRASSAAGGLRASGAAAGGLRASGAAAGDLRASGAAAGGLPAAGAAAGGMRASAAVAGRRRWSAAWLVAAASMVVAVAALAWVAVLQLQISDLRASLTLASERAARFDRVANVLASDRLAVKPLQPAQAAAASTGYVFLDPASGTGMLMCHDLPPVQQGHAYQVWFVRGNDRVSGGMLWPDPRGDGYTMIQVPPDVQSYDSIGLTDEPGSGSAWPTTPRVIGTPLKESSQ